jgi:hypothetical protein
LDKQRQEQWRAQQASHQAYKVVRDIAGLSPNAEGGTYLVSDFSRRDDLPVIASLRKMSNTVAKKLAEMGLKQPISLQLLPNRWWKVAMDAAEVGLVSEYGNACVSGIMSTEALMHQGFEVEDGPFIAWENQDISKAILKSYPGKFWDARTIQVAEKPDEQVQLHYSGSDNGYTSEALMAALDLGDSIQVFSGPYESEDDARYALDVRWEVPD